MARKRMVDPSIWADEGMAELTPRQQLLYIGLFSNADDEGRLKGSPAAVALMLPAVYGGVDRSDVAGDIDAVLASMRQLVRYEHDGRPYLCFLNYSEWQRIDRPLASSLPGPDDPDSAAATPGIDESSASPRRTLDESSASDRGRLDPNRKEVSRREEKVVEPSADGIAGAPADAAPSGAAHANDRQPTIRSVPKTRTAKSRIGADWEPSERLLAWAAETLHVPPDFVAAQTELFRDHWLAKGEPMADWEACWRKWMRNAVEFASRDAARAGANGRRSGPSLAVVPEASPAHRAAGTPLPEGWWPSEEQMAAARRFGLTPEQVETLTGEFVAHARATGKASLDWSTAWQTRLRLVAQQGVAS